jgi:murein L,D-transpeptidase YafK
MNQEFINNQLSYEKVSRANNIKLENIKRKFQVKKANFPNNNIYWRAFKGNKRLELWAYSTDSQKFVNIDTFHICETGFGDLGPKRREGDFQIPEGLYYLNQLNPVSKYYLSLRVSYPNKSDSILGKQGKLGSDIYVHGGCETIGCLPMTNEIIEDIYLINMYSYASGQTLIPIHIFPCRMTVNNLNKLKKDYTSSKPELIPFWIDLKLFFDYFDKYKMVPKYYIDQNGKYILIG